MIAYAVLKRALDHHLNTERRAEFHLPLWARTAAGAGANVICRSIMYPSMWFAVCRWREQQRSAGKTP